MRGGPGVGGLKRFIIISFLEAEGGGPCCSTKFHYIPEKCEESSCCKYIYYYIPKLENTVEVLEDLRGVCRTHAYIATTTTTTTLNRGVRF